MAQQDWLSHLVRHAVSETARQNAGGETMLAKLAELFFIEIVRQHIDRLPMDTRGWLSGLRHPQIGHALRLIHGRPADDWTIERLARGVGLSRSVFADRFTHFAGVTPMQYLARWRMQLAARRLETPGITLAQAGAEVGYESEAAFNRAFKKIVGTSPGSWRRQRSVEIPASALPFICAAGAPSGVDMPEPSRPALLGSVW